MSSDTVNIGAGSMGIRIEPLKGQENWMPWKRRMLAIFCELELDEYIKEGAAQPSPLIQEVPTEEDVQRILAWRKKDEKVRTQIQLAVTDAVMIHLLSATTARDMWKQLCTIYESRGRLGIIAIKRTMYHMEAMEDFNMRIHISELRKKQEELHVMGCLIQGKEFISILILSLPESWDIYMSAYLGANKNEPTIRSHELIAVLIEEFNRKQ